jgi:serine/threonine protein kinase
MMDAIALSSKPAQHVGGYRIERVLGRGRASTVYLALAPGGGPTVALKVMPQSVGEEPAAATALEWEFAAMAGLVHPHILRAIDQGVAGGQCFLAMEYAAGGPMVLHRGAMSAANTLACMRQAAEALAFMHGKGWVHRDVKPANLLLRLDGTLALGDFGSARRHGHLDVIRPGLVVGTPRYAAPEQSQGAAAHPTADVYSLGACLYEMLMGQPVYPGETLTELFSQHLLAPVPRLPHGLRAWQPLLDAMLAKLPSERLPDGAGVVRQLQRISHELHLPQGNGEPT